MNVGSKTRYVLRKLHWAPSNALFGFEGGKQGFQQTLSHRQFSTLKTECLKAYLQQ